MTLAPSLPLPLALTLALSLALALTLALALALPLTLALPLPLPLPPVERGFAGTGAILLRVDPIPPQLPLKSPSIDSQRGGRLRDVAACLSQDPFDVIAFDVGQARGTGLA